MSFVENCRVNLKSASPDQLLLPEYCYSTVTVIAHQYFPNLKKLTFFKKSFLLFQIDLRPGLNANKVWLESGFGGTADSDSILVLNLI